MASTQNFNLVETKEQTTEEISRILTKGTIGVSTTPYDIIGKSGTTAAMLEHGLPILAFDDGDTPNDYLFIYKVFRNNVFLLNEECNTEKNC